jgi:hypothetical protein
LINLKLLFDYKLVYESLRNIISNQFNYEPLILFSNLTTESEISTNDIIKSIAQYKSSFNTAVFPLNNGLPQNIHLLSLQVPLYKKDEREIILRLQHLFELNQDNIFSSKESIFLKNIFDSKYYYLTNLVEKTLTLGKNIYNFDENDEICEVVLNPAEIKTFYCFFSFFLNFFF